MGIDERVVEETVRRILAIARPRRVILFGSAAAGRMTRDGDLDASSSRNVRETRAPRAPAFTTRSGASDTPLM